MLFNLEQFNNLLSWVNGYLWSDIILYLIVATGLVFLILTKFSPILALTHGIAVVLGKFDSKDDEGAINHFQALSAALSATVGLGNIAGVAIAIALGGPGAVFWMWMVGLIGMGLKTIEVTQSMLYRNVANQDDPHGGPMFVISRGLAKRSGSLAGLGKLLGSLFCVTLLISTVTGGNMFQAWNVGTVTEQNFGFPAIYSGLILAVITAAVILGGIKRIGAVAATLVPAMCGLYLLAAIAVLILHIGDIPAMFKLIFVSAFNPTEAQGAFLGGSFGYAFAWGMKRALFSNEAGQGSAPIAHSAVKTNEPVREGVVAGLEPFIDTIIVCTMTALVILVTGVWNRPADYTLTEPVNFTYNTEQSYWEASDTAVDAMLFRPGDYVFTSISTGVTNANTGNDLEHMSGEVLELSQQTYVRWKPVFNELEPTIADGGVYREYVGAGLTSYAFDTVFPGLGVWLVSIATWLFAISTIISWSYYGEQGIIFLFGQRAVVYYKIIYCLLVVTATTGIIQTTQELDNLSGLGTGVMLLVNIPIMWIFAREALTAYHKYRDDLASGKFTSKG